MRRPGPSSHLANALLGRGRLGGQARHCPRHQRDPGPGRLVFPSIGCLTGPPLFPCHSNRSLSSWAPWGTASAGRHSNGDVASKSAGCLGGEPKCRRLKICVARLEGMRSQHVTGSSLGPQLDTRLVGEHRSPLGGELKTASFQPRGASRTRPGRSQDMGSTAGHGNMAADAHFTTPLLAATTG